MDQDPVRCSECNSHFLISPGMVTDGLACPECGGKRLFRDQPNPTQSDGTLRDMVDTDTQVDRGGNPFGEGTIMHGNTSHSATEQVMTRPATFNTEPYDPWQYDEQALELARRQASFWDTVKNIGQGIIDNPVQALPGLAETALGTAGDFVPGVDLGPSEALQAEGLASLGEAGAATAAEDAAAASAQEAESGGQSLLQKGLSKLPGQLPKAISPLMKGVMGVGQGGSTPPNFDGGISQAPGLVQTGSTKDIPMLLVADFETMDSVPSVDEQGAEDPHGFDQQEFSVGDTSPSNFHNPNLEDSGAMGEDNVRSDSASYQGFADTSPGIERAEMVMPLLMHYYHSGESGERDPIIRGLHDALEQEQPGYLQNAHPEADQALQQLVQQHRSPSAIGVHAGVNMQQLPGGTPTTGPLPGQPPVNPVPQPQQPNGACPNCGGVLGPDGSCPQCGNGNNGTVVPPTNLGGGGMMTPMAAIASHLAGYDEGNPWQSAAHDWMAQQGVTNARSIHELAQRHYQKNGPFFPTEGDWPASYDHAFYNMGGGVGGPRMTDDLRQQLRDHVLNQTPLNAGAPSDYQHPDPWMDSEPGTMTFPEHWARIANHQGPVTPEQIAAVQEVLVTWDQTHPGEPSRAEETPNVPLHPEQYAKELAEIQNIPNVAPQIDPSQLQQTPPPAMQQAPGAMPGGPDPGQAGPGGQPMQPMASEHTADANTNSPRCPKCGSGTTSVDVGGSPQNLLGAEPHIRCHSCGNIWSTGGGRVASIVLADEVELPNPALQPHEPHMKWADVEGNDLMPGQSYELHSSAFTVPTEIRIMQVKPDGLDVQLLGGIGAMTGQPDFKISRQEAQLEKYEFVPMHTAQNTEPDTTPGQSPDQVPPLDTTDGYNEPDVTPHSIESSVDTTCKCGSTAVDSRMTSPETTEHECVKCGSTWETRDEDEGRTARVDLSWINSSDDWSPSERQQAMMEVAGGRSRNIHDIASKDERLLAIRAKLDANEKVAGKMFSPAEKRALIDEHGSARNLTDLDLEGTHYTARTDWSDKANGMNVDDDHFALGL